MYSLVCIHKALIVSFLATIDLLFITNSTEYLTFTFNLTKAKKRTIKVLVHSTLVTEYIPNSCPPRTFPLN